MGGFVTTPRPLRHLNDLATRYPGAWSACEDFRSARGRDLPDWPPYVYVPVAAAYAVVSDGKRIGLDDLARVRDVAALGALAAWRMTKGVYRFDPDILGALWDTPLTGDLPSELLTRLPEWCVYVETPGRNVMGRPLHGFYAHLEHDPGEGRQELRLLLDDDDGLSPLPLHVGSGVGEGLQGMSRSAERSLAEYGVDPTELRAALGRERETADRWAEAISPLVSLVLYLCSERPDIGGPGTPGNPQPKRVKGGPKLFAAPGVRTWDIAYRLGAAFRQAKTEASGGGSARAGAPSGRTGVTPTGIPFCPAPGRDSRSGRSSGCRRSRSTSIRTRTSRRPP